MIGCFLVPGPVDLESLARPGNRNFRLVVLAGPADLDLGFLDLDLGLDPEALGQARRSFLLPFVPKPLFRHPLEQSRF